MEPMLKLKTWYKLKTKYSLCLNFIKIVLIILFVLKLKMTPLHWAVEKGHIDVVQILLAHGASANGMNKVTFSTWTPI